MTTRKRSRRHDSDDEFDNDDDEDDHKGNDNGAKWACQSCTFQNRFGAFKCSMCGARKGTSTRKARLSENVVEMQKTINDLVIKQNEKEKYMTSRKRREKSVSLTPSLTNSSFAEPSGSAPRTPVPSDKGISPAPSEEVKRSPAPSPRIKMIKLDAGVDTEKEKEKEKEKVKRVPTPNTPKCDIDKVKIEEKPSTSATVIPVNPMPTIVKQEPVAQQETPSNKDSPEKKDSPPVLRRETEPSPNTSVKSTPDKKPPVIYPTSMPPPVNTTPLIQQVPRVQHPLVATPVLPPPQQSHIRPAVLPTSASMPPPTPNLQHQQQQQQQQRLQIQNMLAPQLMAAAQMAAQQPNPMMMQQNSITAAQLHQMSLQAMMPGGLFNPAMLYSQFPQLAAFAPQMAYPTAPSVNPMMFPTTPVARPQQTPIPQPIVAQPIVPPQQIVQPAPVPQPQPTIPTIVQSQPSTSTQVINPPRQPATQNSKASATTSAEGGTHVSPTISRLSSETDSSSDGSTARSLEPPSEEPPSRISDNMVYRDMARKITVVANGVPAVFFEFQRRQNPPSQQNGKT